LLQEITFRLAKTTQPQILYNLRLMFGDRLATLLIILDQISRNIHLKTDEGQNILHHLKGLLSGEPIGQPHKGQLISKAQPVVSSTAGVDEFKIRRPKLGPADQLFV
jgi:hypothetical protein